MSRCLHLASRCINKLCIFYANRMAVYMLAMGGISGWRIDGNSSYCSFSKSRVDISVAHSSRCSDPVAAETGACLRLVRPLLLSAFLSWPLRWTERGPSLCFRVLSAVPVPGLWLASGSAGQPALTASTPLLPDLNWAYHSPIREVPHSFRLWNVFKPKHCKMLWSSPQ